MKNQCSGTQCRGFQFLQILDLWGIRFHAMVVFGLGENLLFKSVLGHCELVSPKLFLGPQVKLHKTLDPIVKLYFLTHGSVGGHNWLAQS